jgi:hypothetical protein
VVLCSFGVLGDGSHWVYVVQKGEHACRHSPVGGLFIHDRGSVNEVACVHHTKLSPCQQGFPNCLHGDSSCLCWAGMKAESHW